LFNKIKRPMNATSLKPLILLVEMHIDPTEKIFRIVVWKVPATQSVVSARPEYAPSRHFMLIDGEAARTTS
jgi:hypothetical protein